MAMTHILLKAPLFVFLDRLGATLSSDQVRMVLQRLTESSIAYVSIGAPRESLDLFDAILECSEDGGWAWTEKPAARSDAKERLART
jgi:vitamin B12/bleomycin/antimicrobial peptide transport system ATP-binding/permease protein